MQLVPYVLEESVEVLLQEVLLAPQDVAPLDEHVVRSYENVIEFLQACRLGQFVQDLPRILMQLSEQVAHLIQVVDFLGEEGLQSLAMSSELLVDCLHLRDELLHLPVVCVVLLRQSHIHHALVVLAV